MSHVLKKVLLAGLVAAPPLYLAACDLQRPLAPEIRAAAVGGSTVKPPSNPTAMAVSVSEIDVSWQGNSSNESGFELYSSTTGPSGGFGLIATLAAHATGYASIGLAASTQYCYTVRAFKTAGSKTTYSAFSASACATTLAPPAPPAAPYDLTAETLTWQIWLQWLPTSTNQDGYQVERCLGVVCADTDFTVIATTTAQSYGDYSAGWGLTYTYRVRAFNGAGASAPSNEASATACVVILGDDSTYYCQTP